ncbi:hypothetical protein RFI_23443 [Reticulomyxa filosa]|uniref:Uncharacterized protein n=1 Tax=Reticulomyxa filosa TaxID=46433 RepID=X6MJB0_RETFI|nr:hypothetical protein RFI_23443 [Reticulomyxa filosa]|eukprot:ETO13924.1 hypothetical protein RFI_23443 [Reticulomyxa filosa]
MKKLVRSKGEKDSISQLPNIQKNVRNSNCFIVFSKQEHDKRIRGKKNGLYPLPLKAEAIILGNCYDKKWKATSFHTQNNKNQRNSVTWKTEKKTCPIQTNLTFLFPHRLILTNNNNNKEEITVVYVFSFQNGKKKTKTTQKKKNFAK